MPQAIVRLSEHANRVLNIVKAKYGFKDKSQAIDQIALEYEQEILEPEMKPEFIENVLKAQQKGSFRKIKKASDIFR